MKTEEITMEDSIKDVKEKIIKHLDLYAEFLLIRRKKIIEFNARNVSIKENHATIATQEEVDFFSENGTTLENLKQYINDVMKEAKELSAKEGKDHGFNDFDNLFSFLNQIYEDMAFKPIDASSMIFIDEDDKRTIN